MMGEILAPWLAAATAPVWGGSAADRHALCVSFILSFTTCIAMLFIWTYVLAPAIPAYQQRSATDKVFLGNSFVSMWPACTAPFLAILELPKLQWDNLETFMVTPPSEFALRAVGLSCGYMFYDTFYCLYHRDMRSPLIIGHHCLPVFFWPYCTLNHRALPIVLFFVLTEVTNIGQHVRMILLRLGFEHTLLYAIVGVSWVVLFFLVRIAPTPYLFHHLVNGNYAAFTTFEFWSCCFTTPLPFILNSYWFYLLLTGVISFLTKRKKKS